MDPTSQSFVSPIEEEYKKREEQLQSELITAKENIIQKDAMIEHYKQLLTNERNRRNELETSLEKVRHAVRGLADITNLGPVERTAKRSRRSVPGAEGFDSPVSAVLKKTTQGITCDTPEV